MSRNTRRTFLATGASVLGASIAGCLDGSAETDTDAAFDAATVYFDPACGCCGEHADYLASAGVDIERNEVSQEELDTLRNELQIPEDLRSCHTTELDSGYHIEGHVPVEVINEVIEAEPPGEVVSLPGMPSGSPGMPGSKDEEWVFYSIDEDGAVDEFKRK